MRTFLVETYLSRGNAGGFDETVARLRAAAAGGVRYLRSTFVPEDETCFHVLEGPSMQAIAVVSERAELSPIRIVEAQEELR
jgi:hypothetical protein